MKKELRAEAEKNKTWEGQVAKLQSSVSALQTKLSEKDASMASTKSTIEELTATLSATRIEKENMVQMLRARLEAAQESVKKHEKENASLKELFASRDTRVNELEKKVRDMEDESKIQEDIVSKLAES
ncbi:hypothetical protein BC829DRAFT_298418 [Chytridium lagenaria]|nr:hypothetical protein BC829DRAFT_298418 [Chytridium lagenaria]